MTEIVVQKQYPPDAWMAACEYPVFRGTTNKDLLNYALDLQVALHTCNQDKAALREWVANG